MSPPSSSPTPRIFLIRHGETEWTKNTRYTGLTDILLTARGEFQILSSASIIFGPGRLIEPAKLLHAFVSPRIRAKRTFDLLVGEETKKGLENEDRITVEEGVREWEYGDYEGLVTREIRERRKAEGLDGEREWDIWVDGCEGGESAAQVSARLDNVIARIKELQKPFLKEGGKGEGERRDVVVVAHGHILRAFAKRWVEVELGMRLRFMLEPGAVGVLSYDHGSVGEPALLLGVNMGGSEEREKPKEHVWRYKEGDDEGSDEAEKS